MVNANQTRRPPPRDIVQCRTYGHSFDRRLAELQPGESASCSRCGEAMTRQTDGRLTSKFAEQAEDERLKRAARRVAE